jgi:protein-L-isoaspartate(D-aspartate) O-methyltransferase
MTNFARQRQAMVDSQVRVNDVTDPRIIAAMLEIPREKFVPKGKMELSYIDEDLLIRNANGGAPARYLMEPMVLAKLVQALEITSTDRVLDVGCATGYSATLLGRIAQKVTGLEEDEQLAVSATQIKTSLGASNVKIVTGPLAKGYRQDAPYDAILVEGSVEFVPEALTLQLKDSGRLIAVVGSGRSGKAMLHLRSGDVVSARPVFDAAIPPLPGFARPPQFVF